jgi:regulator of sigma E protease
MMDILYSVLSFLLVISIIVITHELGHYLAARMFGVKVVDFAIGWGPTIFSVKDKSGTNWKLCAIPIGGYIKYFGDEDIASVTSNKNLTKEQKKYSFVAQNSIKRSIMVAAGPLGNFLFAILIFTYFFYVNGKMVSDNEVTFIAPNSVASRAGLKLGDRIKSVEGSNISDFSDVDRYVKANPNIPLKFEIERNGESIKEVITPEATEITSDGEKMIVGKLGIGSDKVKKEEYNIFQAFFVSIKETIKISSFTLKTIGQIFTGDRGTKDMASVIRISQYSGKFVKQGAAAFMWFIAMLSINLGLINLFPVPPLDGGHIFLYVVKGLVGEKIAGYVETYAVRIGIVLLIALMVFTIVNDIIQLK